MAEFVKGWKTMEVPSSGLSGNPKYFTALSLPSVLENGMEDLIKEINMIGLRQQSLCWRKLSYLLKLFEQVNTVVEMVKGNIIFCRFSIAFHVIEQRPYPVLRRRSTIVQRKKIKRKVNESKMQIDSDQYSGLHGHTQVMTHHCGLFKERAHACRSSASHSAQHTFQDISDQAVLDQLVAARED